MQAQLLMTNKEASEQDVIFFYPTALRMAKILGSFGRSECNRVKQTIPKKNSAKRALPDDKFEFSI